MVESLVHEVGRMVVSFKWIPLLALLWTGAPAAERTEVPLRGVVSTSLGPAVGARVTAIDPDSAVRISGFTDGQGRYELGLTNTGRYRLEARNGSESAHRLDVEVSAGATADLILIPDPDVLTAVPSDRWLALLPEGEMKREFILNCTSCHEIDAQRVLIDGHARTRGQWASAFAAMRAIDQYALLPQDFDDAAYGDWLAQYWTDDSVRALEPRGPAQAAALAGIRITEYPLPIDGELPHDLVVGPDGRIWITAFFNDVIWALDSASGEFQTFALRGAGAEGWGQARALVFDARGRLWVLLGGTHELVMLDPASGATETHAIGMYAHSLALDSQGRVWFNDYFARAERIGVFDPETGTVEHLPLPSAGLSEAAGLPLPYGLQIDRAGRLYSTQLAANTVALYDTRSGESQLIPMPYDNVGPRRPAVDAGDRLWIPEWNTGYLSRFDPQSGTFERFQLGSSALGGYDAEVDPLTGEVWVTGALAASMVVFDPESRRSLEIPLPTNPAYTRHLAVDPRNGDLWSAYSSLPAAKPRVVRIERAARQALSASRAAAP